ncbi:polyphenol oxidase family protein [Pseudomonas sp. TE3610]
MSWTARNLTDIPGIAHGFLGIDDALPANTFYCNQKHTADIVEPVAAAEGNTGPAPQQGIPGGTQGPAQPGGSGYRVGDGVFTQAHTPVAVMTADCLPVLIASTDGQQVAAVHGGWKGLKAGILGNALARFDQAEVARDRLRIAIGPSIRPCCYEVSADFSALWPGANPPWYRDRPVPTQPNALPQPPAMNPDGLWFDLAGYAMRLLAQQGIEPAQIEVVDICTCCHTPALGSYRRRTHWPATRTQQFSWIAQV